MTGIVEFLTARLDEMRGEAADYPGEEDIRWYRIPTISAQFVIDHCDATLRLLDEHEPIHEQTWQGEPALNPCCTCTQQAWPCLTLRLLAQPFHAHRDFDPAWKLDHFAAGPRPTEEP